MQDLRKQGLRLQESEEFLNYWNLVQNKAEELGCVYFLQCGDGHEYSDKSINCEDTFGWLIPKHEVKEFEEMYKNWKDENISNKYDDKYFKSQTWSIVNNKIEIIFS